MKRTAAVLAAICILCACAACAGSGLPRGVNKAFDQTQMISITGQTQKLSEDKMYVGDSTYGYLFPQPAAWDAVVQADNADLGFDETGAYVNFIPSAYNDQIDALMLETDDAVWEKQYAELTAASCRIFYLIRASGGDAAAQIAGNLYAHLDKLIETGDVGYYLAYNDSFDESKLTDADKADVQALLAGLGEIRESLMVFPPQESPSSGSEESSFHFGGDLSAIQAQDTAGNEVTSAIFAPYDVTIVNIWETTCGSCVGEMSELARLKGMLPANANLISLCLDGADEPEAVEKILSSAGATFTTLVENDNLNQNVSPYIDAIPTTIFVDSQGKTLGGFIGVPEEAAGGGVAESYLSALQTYLDGTGR